MSNCCILCEIKGKTDSEKLVSLNTPSFLPSCYHVVTTGNQEREMLAVVNIDV